MAIVRANPEVSLTAERMAVVKSPRSHNQHTLLLRTTKIGLMFTVPYASHLSISGRGRGNLVEEIGFLTVKCVVCTGGGGGGGGAFCITITGAGLSEGRAHLLVLEV